MPGTTTKKWLYGKTLAELANVVTELGMPRFTAKQIAVWLYKKGARSIEAMTDISVRNREALSAAYTVGDFERVAETVSVDGTRKYLFPTIRGGAIETAYIPDGDRATLCVSSQAGCRMGCQFCMTGRQGLSHDLTAGEILNQMRAVGIDGLTNVVYMGMGEPLDNPDEVLRSLEVLTSDWGYGWSPTRITVSTIGINTQLGRFLDETKVHMAVSLHNPFHEERLAIMPAEKAFPISETVETLRRHGFSGQRRVSFEYIVMAGLNDTPAHVKGIARLLNGLKCRINLIRFHKIPGSPFFSPPDGQMAAFRDALVAKGIITTIRQSRGEDIKAACGMLSTSMK